MKMNMRYTRFQPPQRAEQAVRLQLSNMSRVHVPLVMPIHSKQHLTGTHQLIWQHLLLFHAVERHRSLQTCSCSTNSHTAPSQYQAWQGSDEFSVHKDRINAPPVTLPAVSHAKRVTLVRHGQSTWNAEERFQGSSNISVLTTKGIRQAEATKEMLADQHFHMLFHSPLQRAAHTADIIWGDRLGPRVCLPGLREIDLYSFQGLVKAEGRRVYGEHYQQWQQQPHDFELDGHFPVRELWHRASQMWQHILTTPPEVQSILVVAHNNINQALVATALGMHVSMFRRMPQANAASSQLLFEPATGTTSIPSVTLKHLNQGRSSLFKDSSKAGFRLVLMATASSTTSEKLMGADHLQLDIPLSAVISATLDNSQSTDSSILQNVLQQQQAAHGATPAVQLLNLHHNNAGEQVAQQIICAASDAYHTQTAAASEPSSPTPVNVLVLAPGPCIAVMLCWALGLPANSSSAFDLQVGGLTILEYTGDPATATPMVQCVNRFTQGPKL